MEVFLKNRNDVIERSTFKRKMKIIVAGALRVITTQGKTNMTISRCIFEDIAMEARITFYFYEEAETVMIGSIDGLTGKMHFIHFVMSVYKSMFNRSMKALAVHLQDSPQ